MNRTFYARYVPPQAFQTKTEACDVENEFLHPVKKIKKHQNSSKNCASNHRGSQTPADRDGNSDAILSRHPKRRRIVDPENTDHKIAYLSLTAGTETRSFDTDKKRRPYKISSDDQDAKESISLIHKETKRSSGFNSQDKIESLNGTINDDENSKHKSIRSKFERSSRAAASLDEKKRSHTYDVNEVGQNPSSVETETYGLVPFPQPSEVLGSPLESGISALPYWLTNPIVISSDDMVPFQDLLLSRSTVAALESKGYTQAFAVQSKIIPMLLPGPKMYCGDLCISASTGSGKTLAYAIPMVESLKGKSMRQLRGLIVVPTRELVSQVCETLQICISGSGLKISTAVGSKSFKEEQDIFLTKDVKYSLKGYRGNQEKIEQENEGPMNWEYGEDTETEQCRFSSIAGYISNVDIIICTPGRLVDHLMSTKGFTLEHLQWLVVDEADRLLNESFQQWTDVVIPALQTQPQIDSRVQVLLETFHMRETRNVRKIILSATMTNDLSKLTPLKLSHPALVVLENVREADETIDTFAAAATESLTHQVGVDLPPTLNETAISVITAEDKPLYLIKVLEGTHGLPEIFNHQFRFRTADEKVEDKDYQIASAGLFTSEGDKISDDLNVNSKSSTSPLAEDLYDPRENQRKLPDISSRPYTRGALIFTNNNENAVRLAHLLTLLRPLWAPYISSLTKSSRSSASRKTLKDFQKGGLSVIVASDRASRGLDIQDLAHVINYDMPTSLTSYVHRIGRTARAGKEGTATTLVAFHEAGWFWSEIAKAKNIRRGVGQKVCRVTMPSDLFSDEARETYKKALNELGLKARGKIEE